MHDDLLTAEEVAERLRLKPDTIIVWARQGRIPAHRLTRKVIRFSFEDVIAALGAAPTSYPISLSAFGPEGES